MDRIKACFQFELLPLQLDQILPTRQVPRDLKESGPYKKIVSSIREVGVIEPLVVYPHGGGKYILLEGHVRLEALKELGQRETLCLISTSDEAYNYNHKVNRVAPIQANRMILQALDAGVPEEAIAKALNLSLTTVRQNRSMLLHLCAEAVELLKDKQVPVRTLLLMKKVKELRQIEMAEMMTAAANYSTPYAKALLLATSPEQLVTPDSKKVAGVKPEDIARMEQEMRATEKNYLLVEETYNRNVVELTIVRTYLKKLLENTRVTKFLTRRHGEILTEFKRIVESNTLDG